MILSRWAVIRPVATLMAFLTISLIGVISWFKLPQDLFPPVSYPQVTIVTAYPNAAPEEVETLITKPIEESISTVSNLKRVKSISREGLSVITAEFGWSTKIDFAALGVRQKIDLVKESLPREAKEPIVKKINPFDLPVLILSLRGDIPEDKLLNYAKKVLKEGLSKVDGVASVAIQGGREYEIFVDVDAGMLRARNIDITKIGRVLKEANLNYPAGTTKEKYYEYLIRTQGEYEKMDEIGNTVIDADFTKNNTPGQGEEEEDKKPVGVVRLSDIATIKKEFAESSSKSRFNGSDNILLSVYKQSDANTLSTVRKLHDALKNLELTKSLPVKVDVVYDKAVFIMDAIANLKSEGIHGGLLSLVVLLFFLQSFSASLIVALAIPSSILITFIFMYLNGVTINLMSLGGLALGVGIMVDCSVVVVENFMRMINDEKSDPKTAAIEGANKVWASIFASTLTSIAVFFPMAFLSGVEGQIFKQLAFTVTFSHLASLFVSLTLVPRFAFKNIGASSPYSFFKKFEEIVHNIEKVYRKTLHAILPVKNMVLTAVFGIFIASVFLFNHLPKEMMPKVDEGQFGIKAEMPPGTRLEVTDSEVRKIEKILLEDKNVENVSVNIGSNASEALEGSQFLGPHQANITVVLQKKRSMKTDEFIEKFYKEVKQVLSPNMSLEFKISASGIASAFSIQSPVVIRIQSEDNEKLNRIGKTAREFLNDIEGLINIKTTRSEPSPETKIIVDKQRASLTGLSAQDISLAAQTAIKGTVTTEFKDEKGIQIPIRVRLAEKDRASLDLIENIPIWSGEDSNVFLGDLVSFKKGMGPSEILRMEQHKVILISADVMKGYDLQQIRSKIKQTLSGISNDKDVEVELVEATAEEKGAATEMIFTLTLSILLVYMIMAAQFESLLQPFLIMFTVPLGIIGVSFSLWLTGTSLSVVSALGMILLGGIVVNNGIILVEYFNHSRKPGQKIEDGVIDACVVRFRPIMITTLTNLLGLIPVALGMGEGSELMSPMAISVLGGLFVSTSLTLLVFPMLYITFSRWQKQT